PALNVYKPPAVTAYWCELGEPPTAVHGVPALSATEEFATKVPDGGTIWIWNGPVVGTRLPMLSTKGPVGPACVNDGSVHARSC
ncbi:hypothetical protein AAHH79_36325, partial [Burkholderia pseudomallei]